MNESPKEAAEQEPLSRTDHHLTALSVAHAEDLYLSTLITRAQHGQHAPIAVLTNGMIVFGILTSSREMATHLDAERVRIFENVKKPDDIEEKDWEKARENARNRFANGWDAARKAEDEFFDELPGDDEPLSARDEEQLIVNQREPFLTMKDAQIMAPGQLGATRVGVLRIPAQAVKGWWMPETEYRPDGSHQTGVRLWEDPSSAEAEQGE